MGKYLKIQIHKLYNGVTSKVQTNREIENCILHIANILSYKTHKNGKHFFKHSLNMKFFCQMLH